MSQAKHTKISQSKILWNLLQQLWRQDRGCQNRILLAGLISIIALALKSVTPITIKIVADVIEQHTITKGFLLTLVLMSYGMVWSLAGIATMLRQIIMYRVFERSISNLILKLFQHLNTLSLSYHLSRKTGAITNAIEKAQVAIPKVLWGLLFSIIPTVFEILIAMCVLGKYYGISYAMALLIGLTTYTIFTFIATQYIVKYQRVGNNATKEAMAYLVDRLLNFEIFKNYHTVGDEVNKCKKILDTRENEMTRQLVYMDVVGIGQVFIMGVMLTWLTWFVGSKVLHGGGLSIGDFIMVNAYIMQFMGPMNLFGYILRQMRQGLTDMENVTEILSEENIIMDHPHAKPLVISKGTIHFKNVFFSYSQDALIMQNMNLIIEGGKNVAIVGQSGSGKTTLIRLLLRLYEPDSGKIIIDNQDISLVTQQSLRNQIAIVPQNPILFNDTIYANMACDNNTLSIREIDEVLDLLKMKNWLYSLPMSYDTVVGEQGVKLSGGEKQRILIARALLKNAKIFIFDEATASLDHLSEGSIKAGIKNILSNATIITISHKFSTIRDVDKIVVLDKGKIIEEAKTPAEKMHLLV